MIKILSGELKGRKLKSLSSVFLRPTQAIVRKSIMDSVRNFDDKNILDLFSGIGSLGIESISRGAKKVKFVDSIKQVISILKQNINMLNITDRCEIIYSDVFKFLKNENNMYDLIFADPPYGDYNFEELFDYVEPLLNKNGIFCFESNIRFDANSIDNIKLKKFGKTNVLFWEKIK